MNTLAALQSSLESSSDISASWRQVPPAPRDPGGQPTAPADDLARLFNTALISTRVQSSRDWLAEIQRLMETPAFRSLLSSIRHLARAQGISEASAAEDMIRTIRSLDSAWRDYVFQEGLDRIKSSG